MNLKALAGHTIDLDALPQIPAVLDVGCRGWGFSKEVLFLRPHAMILGFDPDELVVRDRPHGVGFFPIALVGDQRTDARMAKFSTGEGNFITDLESYYDAEMVNVVCTNIVPFMEYRYIKHFDVVKLDCEGSEFGILENWPGPIASQISVEFHDSGYTPGYGPDYDYGPIFDRLKNFGYRIVQHELSKQGEGTGHWDTLLAL